jgi:hypothetical protein
VDGTRHIEPGAGVVRLIVHLLSIVGGDLARLKQGACEITRGRDSRISGSELLVEARRRLQAELRAGASQ